MKHLAIAILSSIIGLSGCGGSKVSPLTAEQKSEFGDTLDSVGKAQRAGRSLKGQTQQGGIRRSLGQNEMEQKLSHAFQNHQCGYTVHADTPPKTFGTNFPNGKFSFAVTVYGNECPILLSLDAEVDSNGSPTAANISAEFDLSYTVQDVTYLPLNDISAFALKGSASVSGSQSGFDVSVNIVGSLHSQRRGDIKFDLSGSASGNMQEGSGKFMLALNYPTYRVELGASVSASKGAVKEEFTLNGEVINREHFLQLLAKLDSEFGKTSVTQVGSSSPFARFLLQR